MKKNEITFENIPLDLEPDENIKLWRYMSFSSLYEILINNYIPLIAMRNFSDKSEGAILKGILSQLPNEHPDNIPHIMQLYYESIFISSWHNSENENAAMWDRYTYGGEGVAIKTNAKLLLDCIKSVNADEITEHQFFSKENINALHEGDRGRTNTIIKPVKYTHNQPQDFYTEEENLNGGYDKLCFFYKLEDFKDEAEVRILKSLVHNAYKTISYDVPTHIRQQQVRKSIGVSFAQYDSLPLKINSAANLIQKIIVSPHAHNNFITTVKQSIANINYFRGSDPIPIDRVGESRRKQWV